LTSAHVSSARSHLTRTYTGPLTPRPTHYSHSESVTRFSPALFLLISWALSKAELLSSLVLVPSASHTCPRLQYALDWQRASYTHAVYDKPQPACKDQVTQGSWASITKTTIPPFQQFQYCRHRPIAWLTVLAARSGRHWCQGPPPICTADGWVCLRGRGTRK
jgi:hypothetical protein